MDIPIRLMCSFCLIYLTHVSFLVRLYVGSLCRPSRIGERKRRSDRLIEQCPKALRWIQDRIDFHTQPSPCDVKTKHDHTLGNHVRSDTDNSWVCKFLDRCSTKPVRYLMGSKLQLYMVIMKEMAEAVRMGGNTLLSQYNYCIF